MLLIDQKDRINEIKRKKHKLHVFLLFIYILITPLSMVELPGIGSGMKIASIFILMTGLLLLFSSNTATKSKNRLALAWAAYVVYTFISIFWSTNFQSSLQTAVGLIQLLVISLVLTRFDFYDEDKRIIEFAWILVAFICLFLFFGGSGQQYAYGGRTTIVLSSGGADPNEFCAYFYMALAILVVRLFRNKPGLMTPLYISLVLVIFYCILMTGSRGGMLSALAVVVISWLFSKSISIKKIAMLTLFILLIYFVFQYLFVPNLPQSVLERLQFESMIEDKGSGRTIIWEMALNDIFSGTTRVIYGYGPFGVTFMRDTMHNHFLQALIDGGIIGLTLFLNFFFELTRKAFRNGPVFIGGMAGAFTAMLTLSAYSFFKPIWLIFMMCLLTTSKNNNVEKTADVSIVRVQ
jgi:O-antigen ligase